MKNKRQKQIIKMPNSGKKLLMNKIFIRENANPPESKGAGKDSHLIF
jgi:hypothetical protein